MIIDTWATTQNFAESLEGMSRADIEGMSVAEYSRRTSRQTPAQAAIAALDGSYTPSVPQAPQQPPAPAREPQQPPQGIDVSQLSMGQYAQLRAQLGVTGREYGVGVMNGGAGSADWIAAASAKSGRSAMNESGIQQPAQIDGSKYLRANEPVVGRATFYK